MYRYLAFSILGIIGISVTARETVMITPENMHRLSSPDGYYIISEDIDFGREEVKIGARSVLKFQGGSITAEKIVFHNNSISSPSYQIFKVNNWSGTLTNDVIPANWFGDVSNPRILGQLLTSTAAQARNSEVVLGPGQYTLATGSGIQVKGQGVKLRLIGNIASLSSTPLLSVSGSYHNISAYQLSSTSERATLISVEKSLSCSSINWYRMDCQTSSVSSGIAVLPGACSKFNKINFQTIKAAQDLVLDLNKGGVSAFNVYRGGRLLGGRGIYASAGLNGIIESEKFDCFGFEGLNKASIVFNRVKNSLVQNARMSESYRRDSIATLTSCNNIELDFKSGFNYPTIWSKGNLDCTINAWIMRGVDTAYDLYFNQTDISQYGQYITNQITGLSITNSINVPVDATRPLSSLYTVNTGNGKVAMANCCNLTVSNGATLTLTSQRRDFLPPLTIELHLSGNAKVVISTCTGAFITLTNSGTYQLDQLMLSVPNEGERFKNTVIKF